MTPAATPEALVERERRALAQRLDQALADDIYFGRQRPSVRAKQRERLIEGALAPVLADLQRVTAERDEEKARGDRINEKLGELIAAVREDLPLAEALIAERHDAEAALATATAEAASLRAEVEAKDRALKEERARRKAAVNSVREKAAALCDEAVAYFDRTTGHYDRQQAAGSYRATAAKIRLLTPDRTALARAATAGEGRSDG